MAYNIDDKIGRQDSTDRALTSSITATSTPQQLNSLPRRNHIKLYNVGSVAVAVTTASGMAASAGFIVPASGGSWEENTDANIYIVSTGANSEVRVYERSARFNYR